MQGMYNCGLCQGHLPASQQGIIGVLPLPVATLANLMPCSSSNDTFIALRNRIFPGPHEINNTLKFQALSKFNLHLLTFWLGSLKWKTDFGWLFSALIPTVLVKCIPLFWSKLSLLHLDFFSPILHQTLHCANIFWRALTPHVWTMPRSVKNINGTPLHCIFELMVLHWQSQMKHHLIQ